MLQDAPIDQIGVFVRDYAQALAFYQDTLGLTLVWASPGDGNAGFRVGYNLLVVQERADADTAAGIRLYFTVVDIAERRADLLAAGVGCSEIYDLRDFQVVNFADPDGNQLALLEPAADYRPTFAAYLGRDLLS